MTEQQSEKITPAREIADKLAEPERTDELVGVLMSEIRTGQFDNAQTTLDMLKRTSKYSE